MRYVLRDASGRELVCPSLADLHALYAQGFLSDDDLVRPETSARFTPVGQMAALRGARGRRAGPRAMALTLAVAGVLALVVGLLVRGGR